MTNLGILRLKFKDSCQIELQLYQTTSRLRGHLNNKVNPIDYDVVFDSFTDLCFYKTIVSLTSYTCGLELRFLQIQDHLSHLFPKNSDTFSC